jgi:hypothetical protein
MCASLPSRGKWSLDSSQTDENARPIDFARYLLILIYEFGQQREERVQPLTSSLVPTKNRAPTQNRAAFNVYSSGHWQNC